MDIAAGLPVHSDRIVQDLHLIPYYPADLHPAGTEKTYVKL